MIREAKKSDIDRLVSLGVEFAQVSQKSHGFSVSEEKIKQFTKEVVENPQWVVLALEDGDIKGLLAGIIHTPFFSEDVIAQEVFWYVKDNRQQGLKLMFEFEKIAKERNCKRVSFGYKPAFIDMKDIYEKRGYSLMESQYIKDI